MPSVTESLLDRIGGKNIVDWHRHNGGDIDALEYLGRYQRVLRSGLSRTRLLYLDTNYWVRLRDAELGRGTPEAVCLLQTLRAMVRSREVICVSHLYSFLEIGKQEEASLRVTANLLDELTEAIAIASPADLLAWECAEFIGAKLGLQLEHGLCVWTKAGQIHKNALPDQMPGPVTLAGANVIKKAAIDALWNASFEDIFGQFGWETKSRLIGEIEPQVLTQVEKRKKEQNSRGVSREQVRQSEFLEFVSLYLRPVFMGQLRNWHVQHGFPEGVVGVLRHLQVVLDSAANEFNSRTLGRLLPSATVTVELYTLYEAVYRDKAPLTSNDWIDWNHAAAALAYCDMFFTERHLAHQLRQELKADQQYECEVIGTIEEGLHRLHDERASRGMK